MRKKNGRESCIIRTRSRRIYIMPRQNERGIAFADQKGFLVIFNDSFVESASKAGRPYFFRYMDYARRLKKIFPFCI